MTLNSDTCNYTRLFDNTTPHLLHGSVSRHGGISAAPFFSNNISFGMGDDPENVKKNREAIKKQFGLDYLVAAHQIHGDAVCHISPPIDDTNEVKGYDALITAHRRTGLLIQHADCQAVMIHDPEKQVIAGIHNGWKGSVVNIIATTIAEMKLRYGSKPENFIVAVGPSLGPCCSEFINYRDELPKSFLPFQLKKNYFDFWQITLNQLVNCGVTKDAVTIVRVCTFCSPDHFSFRRANRNGNGITGRNGTLIALR